MPLLRKVFSSNIFILPLLSTPKGWYLMYIRSVILCSEERFSSIIRLLPTLKKQRAKGLYGLATAEDVKLEVHKAISEK